MAKGRAKKKRAAPALSREEEQMRADRERLRRELALQRRVAHLARQLTNQSARTDEQLFSLGRSLVGDRGWTVAKIGEESAAERQNTVLRARVEDLERELAELHRGNVAAGV